MLMSCAVDEAARKVKGKKAIAVEAFGRALRQIPTILADNAGYDSSDLVSKLRAAHYEGSSDAGLGQFCFIKCCLVSPLTGWLGEDMNQGTIGSMKELGITESYKLKRQVMLSASEAAEMIVRSVFGSVGIFYEDWSLPVQCGWHIAGNTPETWSGVSGSMCHTYASACINKCGGRMSSTFTCLIYVTRN
jgi:hypothetical protein